MRPPLRRCQYFAGLIFGDSVAVIVCFFSLTMIRVSAASFELEDAPRILVVFALFHLDEILKELANTRRGRGIR